MLDKIKDFFNNELKQDSKPFGHQEKRLACAALLIEVAIVDQEFDEKELAATREVLNKEFKISDQECEKLITLAQQECEDSTSTYQFTQLVNQYCGVEDKFALLEGLWRIAYADGDLDKYEEYTIRKICDLIHMSHGDFIRAKHVVKSDFV